MNFRLGDNSVIQSAAQVHQWALWKGEACPVVFFWPETRMSLVWFEHCTVLLFKYQESGEKEQENLNSFVLLQNGGNDLILWLSIVYLKQYSFCTLFIVIFLERVLKKDIKHLKRGSDIRSSKHFIRRRNFKTRPSFFTTIWNRGNNCTMSQTFSITQTFFTQVDTNTGASLMLQSGARWLGLSLDLIGSVIVFTSVMAAILIGQTGPAGLGLLISYR